MTREGMTVPNTTLCEKLVSDDNLTKAAKKVRLNGGAPGIDGILAEDALVYLLKNQERIVSEIITRKYKPSPVRRVEIPKANGKKRTAGHPYRKGQDSPASVGTGADTSVRADILGLQLRLQAEPECRGCGETRPALYVRGLQLCCGYRSFKVFRYRRP